MTDNGPDTNLYRINENTLTTEPQRYPEYWIAKYVAGEIEAEELEAQLHRIIVGGNDAG